MVNLFIRLGVCTYVCVLYGYTRNHIELARLSCVFLEKFMNGGRDCVLRIQWLVLRAN